MKLIMALFAGLMVFSVSAEEKIAIFEKVYLSQALSVKRICEWEDGRMLAFLSGGGVDAIKGGEVTSVEKRHTSEWLDVACGEKAITGIRPNGVYRWTQGRGRAQLIGGAEIKYGVLNGNRTLLVRKNKTVSLCEGARCIEHRIEEPAPEWLEPKFIGDIPVLINRYRDHWIKQVTPNGLVPFELNLDVPIGDIGFISATKNGFVLVQSEKKGYALAQYEMVGAKVRLASRTELEGTPYFMDELPNKDIVIGGSAKMSPNTRNKGLLILCNNRPIPGCEEVTVEWMEGEVEDYPTFSSVSVLKDGVWAVGGMRDCSACAPAVYFGKSNLKQETAFSK